MNGHMPVCSQAGWKGKNFRNCGKPAAVWYRATWPEVEEFIDYRCDQHAKWLLPKLCELGPVGTEPTR